MALSEALPRVGRGVGFVAALAGLIGAGWLIVYWVFPYLSISFAGIQLIDDPENLGAENAPIIAFWAMVMAVVSLLTAYAVQKQRLKVLWILAVVLPIFTILSLFSIGQLVAPFAFLTVLSAGLLTLGRYVGDTRNEVAS